MRKEIVLSNTSIHSGLLIDLSTLKGKTLLIQNPSWSSSVTFVTPDAWPLTISAGITSKSKKTVIDWNEHKTNDAIFFVLWWTCKKVFNSNMQEARFFTHFFVIIYDEKLWWLQMFICDDLTLLILTLQHDKFILWKIYFNETFLFFTQRKTRKKFWSIKHFFNPSSRAIPWNDHTSNVTSVFRSYCGQWLHHLWLIFSQQKWSAFLQHYHSKTKKGIEDYNRIVIQIILP